MDIVFTPNAWEDLDYIRLRDWENRNLWNMIWKDIGLEGLPMNTGWYIKFQVVKG